MGITGHVAGGNKCFSAAAGRPALWGPALMGKFREILAG